MIENKYCKLCNQKLSKNIIINMMTGIKIHEFEDGTYCDKCAKLVVDSKRRGRLNG
jgi:hypothetical protein